MPDNNSEYFMVNLTTMDDAQCRLIVENVQKYGVENLVQDDGRAIWHSFYAAEAARRMGEFELASQIISKIGECSFSYQRNVHQVIHRHQEMIQKRDTSPLPTAQISFSDPSDQPQTILPQRRKCPEPLLPLVIRGWNFAYAMARWAGSGFEMRSQEEINERLAICQACIHLVNDHCNLCGCACVEKNQAMNKLALKTERCPIGKWT